MTSFRGAMETFQVSGKLLDQLKTLGREQQATLFMILQTVFMSPGTRIVTAARTISSSGRRFLVERAAKPRKT